MIDTEKEKCETCANERKQLGQAFTQGDYIKAAQIAMRGVKMIVKGGKYAQHSETTGAGLDQA